MATRWSRYFERQMENANVRELVERELAALRLGAEIARLRQKRRMTQTQLAARARMSASKISSIEGSLKNVEVSTLIRIAKALGYRFKPRFVRERSHR